MAPLVVVGTHPQTSEDPSAREQVLRSCIEHSTLTNVVPLRSSQEFRGCRSESPGRRVLGRAGAGCGNTATRQTHMVWAVVVQRQDVVDQEVRPNLRTAAIETSCWKKTDASLSGSFLRPWRSPTNRAAVDAPVQVVAMSLGPEFTKCRNTCMPHRIRPASLGHATSGHISSEDLAARGKKQT